MTCFCFNCRFKWANSKQKRDNFLSRIPNRTLCMRLIQNLCTIQTQIHLNTKKKKKQCFELIFLNKMMLYFRNVSFLSGCMSTLVCMRNYTNYQPWRMLYIVCHNNRYNVIKMFVFIKDISFVGFNCIKNRTAKPPTNWTEYFRSTSDVFIMNLSIVSPVTNHQFVIQMEFFI